MKLWRRIGPWRLGGLTSLAAAAVTALLVLAPGAIGSGNAGYTTAVDDGSGHPAGCLDSPNGINCNNYVSKDDVYMNGGPATGAGLNDGEYYFAVLVPGFQNDGFIQGNDGNLSDDTKSHDDKSDSNFVGAGGGDAQTCRTFHILNGEVKNTYATDVGSCAHATGTSVNGRFIIQLKPYDDTTNQGGVYILAICKVGATSPSDCKFDAFKVKPSNENPPAQDLIVTKSAEPSFTRTIGWDAAKDVDKTLVKQVGGQATFNYTVTLTHDAGTDSNFQVNGLVSVFNPNNFDIQGVTVSDSNSACNLFDGSSYSSTSLANQTVTANNSLEILFRCSTNVGGSNVATATWDKATYNTPTGSADSNTASWVFNTGDPGNPSFADLCVDVTDTLDNNAGNLGTICIDSDGKYDSAASTPAAGVTVDDTGNPPDIALKYARVYNVPQTGCVDHNNTADFTTSDTSSTDATLDDNSQKVTVCGPGDTGALTIGFWKGPNGQALLANYSCPTPNTPSAPNSLSYYLKNLSGYLGGPFSDATLSCNLSTYAANILKAASATDMNKMLRAQMLGTALDVYFSGTGWSTAGIGKIKPPSSFLKQNIGSFIMDLTAICPMIDNLNTGTATCKNNLPSTDAFAAGAVPWSSQSIAGILVFAARKPADTPAGPFTGTVASPQWYSTNRTKQEILKNIFDQINNNLAFAP